MGRNICVLGCVCALSICLCSCEGEKQGSALDDLDRMATEQAPSRDAEAIAEQEPLEEVSGEIR